MPDSPITSIPASATAAPAMPSTQPAQSGIPSQPSQSAATQSAFTPPAPQFGAGGGAPSPQQPPAPSTAIRDSLMSSGIDVSAFANDDQIREWVANARGISQEVQQIRQYAAYGQRAAPHWDAFEAWQRQQAQAQTQPTPAAPQQQQQAAQAQKPWWDPAPEFDPRWIEQARQTPNDPWVQNVLIPKIRNYTDWEQRQTQKLLSNPLEAIEPGLESWAQKWAEKQGFMTQAQFAEHQDKQFANAVAQANASWFYEYDQQGNVIKDVAGKPVFTPAAQAYQYFCVQAAKEGASDIYSVHARALRDTQSWAMQQQFQQAYAAQQAQSAAGQPNGQQQQVSPQAPQQVPAGQQPFLQAANLMNRDGTINYRGVNGQPQNTALSPEEEFRAETERALRAKGAYTRQP